jgi:hypothetical protein
MPTKKNVASDSSERKIARMDVRSVAIIGILTFSAGAYCGHGSAMEKISNPQDNAAAVAASSGK